MLECTGCLLGQLCRFLVALRKRKQDFRIIILHCKHFRVSSWKGSLPRRSAGEQEPSTVNSQCRWNESSTRILMLLNCKVLLGEVNFCSKSKSRRKEDATHSCSLEIQFGKGDPRTGRLCSFGLPRRLPPGQSQGLRALNKYKQLLSNILGRLF